MNTNIEKLREYADLEGSEFGEMLNKLCNLAECSMLCSTFHDVVQREVDFQLKWCQSRFKIVERVKTVTYNAKVLEEI